MKTLIAATILLGSTAVLAKAIPKGEATQPLSGNQRELTSLDQIEGAGLVSGATKIDLWSGSYWPQYQGSLAIRYRDPQIGPMVLLTPKEAQFKQFQSIATSKPMYSYAGTDQLSPAEKYDLLIGDEAMSLTTYSWGLGIKNSKDTGKVPVWRGICDGFASAAQMMPRPSKAVTLKAANGQPITFYPEDIKALGSLSYARSQSAPIFLGKRCLSGALFFTDACDETNPGTFHKAITNRVGRLGKSFIADVSPGGEVWNYPMKSYEITYYNVFDYDSTSKNFRDVMESFDKKKKFSKKDRRPENTAYIVGVTMKVKFSDMRFPHTLATDDASHDKIMDMTYEYDLELDRNINILGGESASKNLPDFIWAPNDRTYPLSDVEEQQGPARSQAELVSYSQAAAKLGQPLASIVERLFEAAK